MIRRTFLRLLGLTPFAALLPKVAPKWVSTAHWVPHLHPDIPPYMQAAFDAILEREGPCTLDWVLVRHFEHLGHLVEYRVVGGYKHSLVLEIPLVLEAPDAAP